MHQELKQCLCCGNYKLYSILDLGQQPPANSFHKPNEVVPKYDLHLMGCDQCWHTQLSVAVDPRELFEHYLYVSGTSETLQQYFREFADNYSEIPGTVLDIACNDGSQLSAFRALGWTTVGVDPARNLTPIASGRGHDIYEGFWNNEIADRVAAKYGPIDLIVAQNVFAHTSEPGVFLDACRRVMGPNSQLIIQTSQAHMFDRGEFDTIYHEHISFFGYSSMQAIARRHGFDIFDATIVDIHGGSYVFELRLGENPRSVGILDERYKHHRKYYEDFAVHARTVLKNLENQVNLFKRNGSKVVGYGAAAKGMTVLNAGAIQLDFIVDDNPLKQGLLCPGSSIPVYGSDYLNYVDHPVVFVPLAWNFFTEIKSKIKRLRPEHDDQFILYFPEIRVER